MEKDDEVADGVGIMSDIFGCDGKVEGIILRGRSLDVMFGVGGIGSLI